MTDRSISVHVTSLEDMGQRFVAAWKAAEAGQPVARDHVTFLGLEAFMEAMSVRRLSQQLGRDYKSVHGEAARLVEAGLIERRAKDAVAVPWDRMVTAIEASCEATDPFGGLKVIA